jgi:hypothetical protein
MSFATYWTYALVALLVLQVIACALVYRYRATPPRRALPFFLAALLVTVAWFVGAAMTRSMVEGLPTFVDDVRTGKIPTESVQSVQIVEQATTDSERTLAEVRDRDDVSACLSALANASAGLKHRNHPETLYSGSLRVVMDDGASHLLPFSVSRYRGTRYVNFYSFHGPAYSMDQSCYESEDLVSFLARHDPRFPR